MKLGITMEGGANRTVFSCGVCDALLEESILPDYFIGVSAGIAYGISYLSKQKGRNLELIQTYVTDKRYMGIHHLLHPQNHCFYNIPFVFDEVPLKLLPFDYESFQAFPGEIVATVTNLHTGKPEYLKVAKGKEHKDVLIASCALPILFQPVKIKNRYYLDGGLSDSIPYLQAIKNGCDKNIVILTQTRSYEKKSESGGRLTEKLYKKYPNIVEDLQTRPERYNACRQQLFDAERQGKIFVIAPQDTLGVKRTERDLEKLTRLYEEGYQQMKSRMEELKIYLAN